MGTIRAMLTKFQTLDLESEIPKIIERTGDAIIKRNQDQLIHGLTAKGEEIEPGYYFQQYSLQKQAQNPLPGLGVPDLRLTGDFYKGFNLKVTQDTFEVDSTDEKAFALQYKYGEYIFGLTKENKTLYATKEFYDEFKSYITSKTGISFG